MMSKQKFPPLRPFAEVLLILTPLLAATPSRAYGYADPGTGAYLYQAIYAAIIGGAFYFRRFVYRFWRKRDK